jgi:LCP family protein required for cell wall assembly
MMDRDRRRAHARETPRARRIRLAIERDEALRAKGIDPDPRARARFASTSPPPPEPVPATPSGKPVSVRRLLKRTAVLVALVLVVGAVLLGQRMAAFNSAVSSSSALSSSLFFPLMGSDRVNVALYGYGGPEHTGGSYLADSINILSINPADNSTTLIPIPRDLWIAALPDLPHGGKVNEVFADGYLRGGLAEAGRLETSLLASVTGLKIEHWMAIDFVGFRGMVDAVGGVILDNPRGFRMTWSEDKYLAGVFDGGTFPAGPLTLDGQRALAYARARYTDAVSESSDFARSVRQQAVLSALRSKLGGGGLGSLGPGLSMMDALKGRMQTDLSVFDLFLLSGHLSIAHRLELTEDVILQAARNSAGQYILAVIGRASEEDYAPLRAFISAGLAPAAGEPSASPS